jgi:phosphoribosylglycinamide formyltransferase-1
MKKIAIFASGNGSNAENIINYFEKSIEIKVEVILANKSDAYVLERANKHGIDSIVFSKTDFYDMEVVDKILEDKGIDYIVLAGFLLLIPSKLIQKFSNRIINIHPALLPKYGGKGMYGMKVHESVIMNAEKESGITIHIVNEHYDEGKIIFSAKCTINKTDTAVSLAEKIHQLEYKYFPGVIEKWILKGELSNLQDSLHQKT